jgi:hypothetical protein
MARAALAAGARIDSGTDEDFCRAKVENDFLARKLGD